MGGRGAEVVGGVENDSVRLNTTPSIAAVWIPAKIDSIRRRTESNWAGVASNPLGSAAFPRTSSPPARKSRMCSGVRNSIGTTTRGDNHKENNYFKG
uniref:Uncharacterized protein n=1 Tax=Arundo donax TaxID=35708 RepID=A0A0A9BP87_ARUDO